MKSVETLEKQNETLQNYKEAVKENKELKVEKTNTEIQMGIPQRNIEELGEKLRIHIDELSHHWPKK
jgi:hypothetical protein